MSVASVTSGVPHPIKEFDNNNKEILKQLLKLPENEHCADCGALEPQWASVNLGIFLCIVCAGIHRHLGVDITRVKSVNLDSWKDSEIDTVRATNNIKANDYWESYLPDNFQRPNYTDSIGLKEQWIKCKYADKAFVPIEVDDPKIKRLNFKDRQGWVYKKGLVVKSWKKRWLKFVGDDHLYYYKNPSDKNHCGSISLKNLGQIDSVSEVDGKSFCFIVSTPKRRYLISCENGADMFVWINNIRVASALLYAKK